MSGNILPLFEGEVSVRVVAATKAYDAALGAAIAEAKADRIPQGLVVALLQGYLHRETTAMMDL